MSGLRYNPLVKFARERRKQRTESESLLWGVLRGRHLANLKFRREMPFESWILDFACVQHKVAVEIDGGYHDLIGIEDVARQAGLEALGWKVLRFSDADVLADVNAVAIAICREIGVEPIVNGKRID